VLQQGLRPASCPEQAEICQAEMDLRSDTHATDINEARKACSHRQRAIVSCKVPQDAAAIAKS
jgi:hypothetical protein